jgi:hypothetical protein
MTDEQVDRYGTWIVIFAGIALLTWLLWMLMMLRNNREDPYRLRTVVLSFTAFTAATAFFVQSFVSTGNLSQDMARLVSTTERAILFIIGIVMVITYGSVFWRRRP